MRKNYCSFTINYLKIIKTYQNDIILFIIVGKIMSSLSSTPFLIVSIKKKSEK